MIDFRAIREARAQADANREMGLDEVDAFELGDVGNK
jgi:hypothetical protein